MNNSSRRWLKGAAHAAPVLAGLMLASCATQPSSPQQLGTSNPSVKFQYRNDEELIQANQRAATFCDQYLSVPRTTSISNGPDNSRIVVFECAPPAAQPGQINPNLTFNYRTDKELLDAAYSAQIYCRRSGPQQVTSNIVSNPNGTKTVTFRCVPRQRTDLSPNAPQAATGGLYRVQPGDTLTSLADDFHVPVSAIVNVNPQLGYNSRLVPLELINVPAGVQLRARRAPSLPARIRKVVQPSAYSGHKVGEKVSIDGVVTPEGKECPVIRDASGQLYALTTTSEALHPGDVVTVQGRVAPADWCHQGISIAITSLHYRTHWGSSDTSDSSNDWRSDRGYTERVTGERDSVSGSGYNRSNNERASNDAAWPRLETVVGVVTHEASDCVTVRAENGTLYGVPARLTNLNVGQKVELKGRRSDRQTCQRGITFDVEEVRRR